MQLQAENRTIRNFRLYAPRILYMRNKKVGFVAFMRELAVMFKPHSELKTNGIYKTDFQKNKRPSDSWTMLGTYRAQKVKIYNHYSQICLRLVSVYGS